MDEFFKWQGWNGIAAFTQVLIAIAAILTLFITLKQFGKIGKSNLKLKYNIGKGIIKDEEAGIIKPCVGVAVSVTNCGFSPIQIESYGIEFVNRKGLLSKKIASFGVTQSLLEESLNSPVVLSGQKITGSIYPMNIVLEDLSNTVRETDRLCLFAVDVKGEKYRKYIGMKYNVFKDKVENLLLKEEINKQ